jgi:hypothetical protein
MANQQFHESIPRESDPKSTHGSWPVVIPLLVAAFEFAWAFFIEGSARVSTLSLFPTAVGRLGTFLAWPLGIVACLLGICYAVEDFRQTRNPQLAQLALMLNGLVILAIVLRMFIVM